MFRNELTQPVLTQPVLTIRIKYLQTKIMIGKILPETLFIHPPNTFQSPDTSKTTCRHSQDTLPQTLPRHPPDIQETPSKHSPDTLKILPIHPLHLCVRKRWAAGGGWVGGFMTIMPRCGSILQAGTCQILSLAENPRWSRVWQ